MTNPGSQRNEAGGPELTLSTAEHTVSGEVDKILYVNEDASFCVVLFHDEDGESLCAAGPIGNVAPGQHAVFTGRWEMHREYGRRLKVRSCHVSPPATVEGIARYLASGILPGVGEKSARAIVDCFGLDTLHVLDTASGRLREIPGFGKKKAEAIRKAWKENADLRDLRIRLEGYGISPAYFKKIFRLYGEKSADVVEQDPYRLSKDVPGIGFLLADRIAERAGIGKNDPRRMAAGITYAFSQMRLGGHVCMPEGPFLDYLAGLLSVDRAAAEEALRNALRTDRAARVRASGGEQMIYEPVMMRLESELPLRIRLLLDAPEHLGLPLRHVPVPRDSTFSEEQLHAVAQACSHAFSILTGGPGVGKTTVVSELVRRAGIAHIPVILAAPTGRAAKRMEETSGHAASTIHRMLKWDPARGKFVHGKDLPLPKALYVVDETSMLDLLLSVAFFRAVPKGSCVVFVGDPDQLPSVGPGSVLNDLIESGIAPVSRLTKIFRQGDGSGIIRAAHAVNAGRLPEQTRPGSDLCDFYWIEKEEPEEAADVIERLIADRIPDRFGLDPVRDIQLLCPMNRGAAGALAMNRRLQTLLNREKEQEFTSGDRRFLRGDKVMQIVNNYDRNVFNGDLGFLETVDPSANLLQVRYDDRTVDYTLEDADQIVPAYAITVHKSQGCEFPAVVMPMLSQFYMMLQRNLLYTGITRAKRLMVLVGSRKAVSMAIRNAVREPRYSMLLEKLKHEARL